MGAWYRANAGGFVTTDGLAAHLTSWSGVDVAPWFDRYVYGRSSTPKPELNLGPGPR